MNVPTLEEWLEIVQSDDIEDEPNDDILSFFQQDASSPLKSSGGTTT